MSTDNQLTEFPENDGNTPNVDKSQWDDPTVCNYCDGIGKTVTGTCPMCGGSGSRLPPMDSYM